MTAPIRRHGLRDVEGLGPSLNGTAAATFGNAFSPFILREDLAAAMASVKTAPPLVFRKVGGSEITPPSGCGLKDGVIGCNGFGGLEVAGRLGQSAVIVPVDPRGRGIRAALPPTSGENGGMRFVMAPVSQDQEPPGSQEPIRITQTVMSPEEIGFSGSPCPGRGRPLC